MNIVIWVVQGLLALAFLASGGMKLATPRQKLVASGNSMAWTADTSAGGIKAIGLLEVLGAVGVVLPAALGIVPVLTPVAAIGLAVVMAGAVIVHLKRHEPGALAGPVVLGLIALFVAITRFGPYPF